MFGRKKRRRNKIKSQTFPQTWRHILLKTLVYYASLPEQDQTEIQGHILVLLDEKNFEPCGNMVLTDEIKLIIAAYAAILLLHRETDYYPKLDTILVYPSAFIVKTSAQGPGSLVLEGEEVRLGEAWQRGVVILAWDSVRRSFRNQRDGFNVPLHEFAHQLDMENGAADGFPEFEDPRLAAAWSKVLTHEFTQLSEDLDQSRPTLISEYGEENPAEFFAVITELFFERPEALQRRHPQLYQVLKLFYRQDPAQILSPHQPNQYI